MLHDDRALRCAPVAAAGSGAGAGVLLTGVPGHAVPLLAAGTAATGAVVLDPAAWALLCHVDGAATVAGLAASGGLTLEAAASAVAELVAAGLVELDPDLDPDLDAGPDEAPATPTPDLATPGLATPEPAAYAPADDVDASIARVSRALLEVFSPAPVADVVDFAAARREALRRELEDQVDGDAGRRAAANDRDAVRAERDALRAEGDALRAERDALRDERDTLRDERDALSAEQDALRAERDSLGHERDALRAERDAARVQADNLRDELATQRGTADELRAALQEQQARLATAEESRLALATALEDLRARLTEAEDAAATLPAAAPVDVDGEVARVLAEAEDEARRLLADARAEAAWLVEDAGVRLHEARRAGPTDARPPAPLPAPAGRELPTGEPPTPSPSDAPLHTLQDTPTAGLPQHATPATASADASLLALFADLAGEPAGTGAAGTADADDRADVVADGPPPTPLVAPVLAGPDRVPTAAPPPSLDFFAPPPAATPTATPTVAPLPVAPAVDDAALVAQEAAYRDAAETEARRLVADALRATSGVAPEPPAADTPAPAVERDQADLAALLRELSSLGVDEPPSGPPPSPGATPRPVPAATVAPSVTRKRKGIFGR